MKKIALVIAGLSGFGLASIIFVVVLAFTAPQAQDAPPVRDTGTSDDGEVISASSVRDMHAGHDMMMGEMGDERAFLEHMIPHHEEAVVTSRQMLGRVTDAEYREFLESVINDQTIEIEQMKEWYQLWYDAPFQYVGTYEPMMPDLEAITDDEEAWDAYLSGMIDHHKSAVEMAAMVLDMNPRRELSSLAVTMMRVQNEEIAQMREWLAE